MTRPWAHALPVVVFSAHVAASGTSAQAVDADAVAVKQAVERFLDDLGARRLDRLPSHFVPGATMVVVRLQDATWSVTTQKVDDWFAGLKAQVDPPTLRVPLTNVTVRVESGHLAHVSADFTRIVNGAPDATGVDYFTLVKDGGSWRLAHIAYTALPAK